MEQISVGQLARAMKLENLTPEMDLDAHGNPEMREKVKAFVTRFREKAGSELCQNVKEKYFVEGDRCLATVELAADVLEEFLD